MKADDYHGNQFPQTEHQSKFDTWHRSFWEVLSIMNIPRCAVRELNKNGESQEQSQLPVQVLTHLLLPLLSFLLPFPNFTVLVLSIGHHCPYCHQGEKCLRLILLTFIWMGYTDTVAIYPHYAARFQVILTSQDSVHISKASLIMHFQEAPLFTNMEDTHMLYLNK